MGPAVVIGVDCDGCDLRAGNTSPHAVLRVDFEQPAITADEASERLNALAQKIRAT